MHLLNQFLQNDSWVHFQCLSGFLNYLHKLIYLGYKFRNQDIYLQINEPRESQ